MSNSMSKLGIDQTGTFDAMDYLTIYDFEHRDDAWGTAYGKNLLYQWFPDAYQTKGQSVHQTPIGKVVVTCRQVVLLTKRYNKAKEWMRSMGFMD